MARYGRDYRGRNLWDRARDTGRHWLGDDRGYDVREGYRGHGRHDYDRDYGWESRDRTLPPWEMNRFRSEGRGVQRDYRGGYGPGYHDWAGGYDRDYGFRGERPRMRRGSPGYRGSGSAWDRPYREMDDRWYGMPTDPYGPYGGEGLCRNARSGGMSPGRYFTGYGIGSAGSYEPY